MANAFVHTELNTTDVAKAKGFYGKLFDWKLEDMPMDGGSYTMIKIGEGTGGGIMANPVPGAPSFWLTYVLVERSADLPAVLAAGRQNVTWQHGRIRRASSLLQKPEGPAAHPAC